jgi:5-methylcytosine-specific restriction endonuclease McrA
MRVELWLFLAAAIWIFHIYSEGKYIKYIPKYKKHFQIAGVVLGTFFLYYLIKKNPMKTGDILNSTNEYIKYLPMDNNTSKFMTPILDFTAKQGRQPILPQSSSMFPVLDVQQRQTNQRQERLLQTSGKKATKRSVSETKKKYVAARQNWRCGKCQNQLSAWFEVDHKMRLEHGGSNHIDNLVALCRECHGEKTALENL